MRAEKPLPVVLLWHMHQPDYRDLDSGEFHQPWTYLHAIKDYTDMAAHLESVPGAQAVVNFVPILLEQIEAYAHSLRAHLLQGTPLCDVHLAALSDPAAIAPEQRYAILSGCLRAQEERMIGRFAPYQELAALARLVTPGTAAYLSDGYIGDLLVWWHLAWLGETVRRKDPRAMALMAQQRHYTAAHRQLLLELICELLEDLLPRYRRLAGTGRVELSCSPYSHPILPLLIDLHCAHETMPDASLPAQLYPGGESRARWQIRKGIEVFERVFGLRPQGVWPSEGALSQATVEMLAGEGVRWVASADQVLGNSFRRAGLPAEHAHAAYRSAGAGIECFFRDDGLSDRIGFTYSGWHADDAVADLLSHLERIAVARAADAHPLVCIALDGENAWEHYPDNAYHFLRQLYAGLAAHPDLELCTFGRWLDAHPQALPAPPLAAGSWVYGTLSTWIGEPAKNRAWDLLNSAKTAVDEVLRSGLDEARRTEIETALAVCEGSDWFWWQGDANPAAAVAAFDALYRQQLAGLYRRLDRSPPAELDLPLSAGTQVAVANGGVMRSSHEN